MSNPVTQENLHQKLLDHFTDGAPSYKVANEPQQALARMKTDDIIPLIEAYKDNACRELLDELYKIEACGWYDMDFDLVDSFDDAFEQGSDRTKAKFEKVIQAKRNTLNQSKEDV